VRAVAPSLEDAFIELIQDLEPETGPPEA